MFDAFGENRELVRFLVFEGFLDDTYYQYTSLFHSGRLSPSDNKFLIQIRAFNNPEPGFQIDNPKEVIAAMREDDFRQNFVLNTILVDCLFSNQEEFSEQITKFVELISSSFEECDAFFSSYYATGKYIPELTSELFEKWPGFASAAHRSSDNITHLARLIAHLPEEHLKLLHQKDAEISEFLSKNLAEVLALKIDFDPDRLKQLRLKTKDLESIRTYPAAIRVLADEGLYEVSADNIDFIFREILGLPNVEELKSKHYSTILKRGNAALVKKIEDNIENYLQDVLLELVDNTEEDISTITKVLSHDIIESQYQEAFIEKQSARLPSLEDVPSRFHATVFRLQKIEASWDNCIAFVTSESFDAETLTTFLKLDDTQAALSSIIITEDKSALPLCQFLFNNNDMVEDSYRVYVRTLPKQFTQFPDDIDEEKILILVEEQKIIFSESAFSRLSEHLDYQVLFIAKNIESYFESKDQFTFDEDFREKLLNSNITDDQKLKIVKSMDLTLIVDLPGRASVIGELFHRTDDDISHLSAEAAQALITNTKPITVQVSLLNKCQEILSDDQVRETLQMLPDPFPEFKPGWLRPTIPKTEVNIELAEWLVKRGIISSWVETVFGDIRVYNRRS